MGQSQPHLGERGAARLVATDAAAAALCPALPSATGAEQSLTHSTVWMCLSGLEMVRQGKGRAASWLDLHETASTTQQRTHRCAQQVCIVKLPSNTFLIAQCQSGSTA